MKLGTKIKKLLAVSVACFTMLSAGSMVASAEGASNTAETGDPYARLQSAVDGGYVVSSDKGINVNVSEKTYPKESGGNHTYKDLIDDNGLVNETMFNELSSSAKSDLLSDMQDVANAQVKFDSVTDNKGKSHQVLEGTVTSWLQELQGCNGVGTQLMDALLQNTKPDYATANRIYEPFSGVVGTALGLIAIILMAALALTMGLDLSYIGIPAFRMFLDGDGEGKGKKPKVISYEAVNAVQVAENGGGGGGSGEGNKVAVGIYFKKRVVMLVILGICLLYLISGNIFTFVSWILDLVSGFLGF